MYVSAIFYPPLLVGIFFTILGGLATVHSIFKLAKGEEVESTEGKPGTKKSLLIFSVVFLGGIFFILFGIYGESWGFSPGSRKHF